MIRIIENIERCHSASLYTRQCCASR